MLHKCYTLLFSCSVGRKLLSERDENLSGCFNIDIATCNPVGRKLLSERDENEALLDLSLKLCVYMLEGNYSLKEMRTY